MRLAVAVVVALAGSLAAAGRAAPARAVAEAVEKEIAAGRFPGAVVMVGTREKVLYHGAFGLAQVTPRRAPMRKDSIFDVASVTKVVCTATAVGICADRGLIDPDGMLLDYLPDYRAPGADKIRLRHLASHTSGFPDSPRVGGAKGEFRGEEVFRQLLFFAPRWPADTKFAYACRNAILLGVMVERVTGQRFDEFCRREIFGPLEMKESAFNRVPPGPRVVGTHNPVLGESHAQDTAAAGRAIGSAGLYSTARDLAHFCQMMLGRGEWRGKRILSERVIQDFVTPYRNPKFASRGFLWQIGPGAPQMGPRTYGHGGNTGISLWIDPDAEVFTLVLTNRTHPVRHSYDTEQGRQEVLARGRVAEAALKALGYGTNQKGVAHVR